MPDIVSNTIYGTMKCAFPIVLGATTSVFYNAVPAPFTINYTDSILMLAAKLTAGTSATILVEQSTDGVSNWTSVATITLNVVEEIVYSGRMILNGNYLRFTTQAMSAGAVYEIYGSGD